MTSWTRITDPDMAVTLLPAWFAARMMATRGSYGFLLSTGDIVRVSRVTSVHLSSSGTILIDVLLDQAGKPEGIDPAWHGKTFLGAPAVGATLATLNLARVELAFELEAAEITDTPSDGGTTLVMPEAALDTKGVGTPEAETREVATAQVETAG